MSREVIVSACVVLLSLTVNASTVTWDNGSGNNLWSTAANWNPDGLPIIDDTVDS